MFFIFSLFLWAAPAPYGGSQARGRMGAAMPEPQRCGIRAVSASYTAAHSNAGSLEVAVLIPGLAPWVKDPSLLWLWHRWVATALTRPPSLGTSICYGCGPRKGKKDKKKKKSYNNIMAIHSLCYAIYSYCLSILYVIICIS